jgi:hypothetical protein
MFSFVQIRDDVSSDMSISSTASSPKLQYTEPKDLPSPKPTNIKFGTTEPIKPDNVYLRPTAMEDGEISPVPESFIPVAFTSERPAEVQIKVEQARSASVDLANTAVNLAHIASVMPGDDKYDDRATVLALATEAAQQAFGNEDVEAARTLAQLRDTQIIAAGNRLVYAFRKCAEEAIRSEDTDTEDDDDNEDDKNKPFEATHNAREAEGKLEANDAASFRTNEEQHKVFEATKLKAANATTTIPNGSPAPERTNSHAGRQLHLLYNHIVQQHMCDDAVKTHVQFCRRFRESLCGPTK